MQIVCLCTYTNHQFWLARCCTLRTDRCIWYLNQYTWWTGLCFQPQHPPPFSPVHESEIESDQDHSVKSSFRLLFAQRKVTEENRRPLLCLPDGYAVKIHTQDIYNPPPPTQKTNENLWTILLFSAKKSFVTNFENSIIYIPRRFKFTPDFQACCIKRYHTILALVMCILSA